MFISLHFRFPNIAFVMGGCVVWRSQHVKYRCNLRHLLKARRVRYTLTVLSECFVGMNIYVLFWHLSLICIPN